jgi:hypothetical protein
MDEATLARSQNYPTSPDDELPYLGQEAGLPQYVLEANTSFRQRLTDKWDVWKEAASQGGIIDQIAEAGFDAVGVIPFIYFDLPGGGDDGVTDPTAPGYSPEYTQTGIPTYPSSMGGSGWWSQFALILVMISGSIGTGGGNNTTGPTANQGQLIGADQLLSLQLIVNKFKPANWACREIVAMYLPTSGTVVYDQLDDDGNYVYDYNTSPIQWGGSDSPPSPDVVEHYPALNLWRWRPYFPQQG